MSIGQKIRNLREAHGWKQDDLANETGLNRASIGNYERGDRVPPVDAAKKIADAFNTSVDRLISNDFGDFLLEVLKRIPNINNDDDLRDLANLMEIGEDDNFLIDLINGNTLPSKEEIKELAFWIEQTPGDKNKTMEKMLFYAGHSINMPSDNLKELDPLELESLIEQSQMKLNSKLITEKERNALKAFIEILKNFRNQ